VHFAVDAILHAAVHFAVNAAVQYVIAAAVHRAVNAAVHDAVVLDCGTVGNREAEAEAEDGAAGFDAERSSQRRYDYQTAVVTAAVDALRVADQADLY